MKRTFLFAPFLYLLAGCASQSSYVHSDATLGRVVVYRNGIAYFERTAHVDGQTLKLAVPGDKVDDFLKSLTVVDARTGKAAPISYPTDVPTDKDGVVSMNIGLAGGGTHDLRLSYVTEAPSWKPSYRVVLGKKGKLDVQAWAIVDNTSGEDWENVELGVGSSSALSFRFDLRSIRSVQRETLHSDGLFALAPPTGGASYGGQRDARVVAELSPDALKEAEVTTEEAKEKTPNLSRHKSMPMVAAAPPPPVVVTGGSPGIRAQSLSPSTKSDHAVSTAANAEMETPKKAELQRVARSLVQSQNTIVVEGYADAKDEDKNAASLERANKAREQLIKNGVDASKVMAVGRGEQAGRAAGVRVVEAAPGQQPAVQQAAELASSTEPIGSSHFESKSRMSVGRGTSAMVSILSAETRGEVVYFYDPENPRGSTSFPFKAVRIENPTDSVLESGPVTVFGDGKFVGEGLTEPIPARSMAFVPFALDRQVVVETKQDESDRIERVITVQRGVFSTEVKHTKKTLLVLHNRLSEAATVYVRHTVADGFKLVAPASAERLGAAYLFPITIEPNGKAELEIDEATPLYRTADIRSPGGMELVSAYLSSAALDGPLGDAVKGLVKTQKEMGNLEQQIGTTHDAMGEYRARADELHAQIVMLRAVKTAGPLVQNLEKKLGEVSDRLSKATLDVVTLQEKLMVARIRFQDGVAELSLDKPGAGSSKSAAPE